MAGPQANGTPSKAQITRLAIVAVVLTLVLLAERYGLIERGGQAPPPVAPPKSTTTVPPELSKAPAPPASTPADAVVIRNVTLRNEDRREIYRGDIDLQPTLERIAAGRKLHFSHDGTTFGNREGRLPHKPPGYYREWVVPTPGENGPGPQRIVSGEAGEVWYTADHYLSFRRIAYTLPNSQKATDR